jgi:FlaA1/EpsC-like NDP-sugar epimerase
MTDWKTEFMDRLYLTQQLRSVMFANRVLLITGGTGSFGNAVIKRFLNTGIKELRIFSRDEKKSGAWELRTTSC